MQLQLLLIFLLIASFWLPSARADSSDPLDKDMRLYKQVKSAGTDALDEAKNLYRQGEFHRAIDTCDKILHDNPGDNDALRYRGRAHMALGEFKEGRQDFLSCSADAEPDSRIHPHSLGGDPNEIAAKALYAKGCLELRNDDYNTAATYFNQALDLFAIYPDCLYILNLALGAQANYADAIKVCIYALSYHPSDFKLWESLSVLCHYQHANSRARLAAGIALSLNPPVSDQDTLKNLVARTDQEDRGEQEKHWKALWTTLWGIASMGGGYAGSDY